jgi:hypothetical protein
MPRINIPAMLGSAAATAGAGSYMMRDKPTPSAEPTAASIPKPIPAPAPSAAMRAKSRVRPNSEGLPGPSAAMQAKPRVRPSSEGIPESETRKAFEKEFAAARGRGDVEFTFRGKPYNTRRADESEKQHLDRMKDAAAQSRMEQSLARHRKSRGMKD